MSGNDTLESNPDEAPIKGRRSVFTLYAITFLGTTLVIATILASYFVFVLALPLYNYIKDGDQNGKTWRGTFYQADAELGFSPIPGAQGAQLLPPGLEIPVRLDQDGFRIPISDPSRSFAAEPRRPIVFTLGCSFTWGVATLAEETYAHTVGELLGGTTRNAGVNGRSLSQMLLFARKFVPTIKPDYLIVQYSPWLAERARGPFAPTMFGKIPHPYFYGETEPALNPPVFRAKTLDLPWERYKTTPRSVADFISFLSHTALPLAIHDGINMLVFRVKRGSGALPAPTTDSAAVERVVYREIAEIGKANGAKLVMVVLGVGAEPVKVPDEIGRDYLIVDANATLISRLSSPDRQHWIKQYAHWRGDPPMVVDFHPNPQAHRIIAKEIVSKLKIGLSAGPPQIFSDDRGELPASSTSSTGDI